jgi:hypothetical protein
MDGIDRMPMEVQGHGCVESVARKADHQVLHHLEGIGSTGEWLIRSTHQILDEDIVVFDKFHGVLTDGAIMTASATTPYPYLSTRLAM